MTLAANILCLTDSYKVTHWPQYPPGTQTVYSYFESRGCTPDRFAGETVFFGLQHILKRYLAGPVVTRENIDFAKAFFDRHFGRPLMNEQGWDHLLEHHGGKLPVSIRAVPEGMVVSCHNVLMTVENTCPELWWLPNYLETLLVQAWYPTTVATLGREMKRLILGALEVSGDTALLPYKLHDFGFRGSTSVESAGIGGAAHLTNFQGTDNLPGIVTAMEDYGAAVCGHSIPAAEHSTMTSWGREGEREAFANMLDQYGDGIVACVSDSYDIYNACENVWGRELRDKVLAMKGTLVIRPDSGHPPVVVGRVLDILGERFGYTVNGKGFKVLHPKVRVIQGDGMDYGMLHKVLCEILELGWSADNVTFGMGGALLQKVDRDTFKFAFKCSAVQVDGAWREVWKEPVTDPGKNSKRGRLKLVRIGYDDFKTVLQGEPGEDVLVEVFRDGKLLRDWTFEEVREQARLAEGFPVGVIEEEEQLKP